MMIYILYYLNKREKKRAVEGLKFRHKFETKQELISAAGAVKIQFRPIPGKHVCRLEWKLARIHYFCQRQNNIISLQT